MKKLAVLMFLLFCSTQVQASSKSEIPVSGTLLGLTLGGALPRFSFDLIGIVKSYTRIKSELPQMHALVGCTVFVKEDGSVVGLGKACSRFPGTKQIINNLYEFLLPAGKIAKGLAGGNPGSGLGVITEDDFLIIFDDESTGSRQFPGIKYAHVSYTQYHVVLADNKLYRGFLRREILPELTAIPLDLPAGDWIQQIASYGLLNIAVSKTGLLASKDGRLSANGEDWVAQSPKLSRRFKRAVTWEDAALTLDTTGNFEFHEDWGKHKSILDKFPKYLAIADFDAKEHDVGYGPDLVVLDQKGDVYVAGSHHKKAVRLELPGPANAVLLTRLEQVIAKVQGSFYISSKGDEGYRSKTASVF